MFKKSKSNKNITAPSAPSLDEVLSDIETFQVDFEPAITPTTSNHKPSDGATISLDSWWKIFENFVSDLKCLEMIHQDIQGSKLKLESHKLEIETEAKLLKNEIEEQKNLINVALK